MYLLEYIIIVGELSNVAFNFSPLLILNIVADWLRQHQPRAAEAAATKAKLQWWSRRLFEPAEYWPPFKLTMHGEVRRQDRGGHQSTPLDCSDKLIQLSVRKLQTHLTTFPTLVFVVSSIPMYMYAALLALYCL